MEKEENYETCSIDRDRIAGLLSGAVSAVTRTATENLLHGVDGHIRLPEEAKKNPHRHILEYTIRDLSNYILISIDIIVTREVQGLNEDLEFLLIEDIEKEHKLALDYWAGRKGYPTTLVYDLWSTGIAQASKFSSRILTKHMEGRREEEKEAGEKQGLKTAVDDIMAKVWPVENKETEGEEK